MLEMFLEILFEGFLELIASLMSSFVISIWEGFREIFLR
jgi:hypothetical protein